MVLTLSIMAAHADGLRTYHVTRTVIIWHMLAEMRWWYVVRPLHRFT